MNIQIWLGNNRQAVFFHDADFVVYLDLLFESAARYEVSVYAFVCITNHVHILLTPWEGRFKSSLVDSERYVLACYRYIELNPVRAGMVSHPAEYRWSSCRHHAIALSDYPIRPHSEWLALGSNPEERRKCYAQLVNAGLMTDEVEIFRRCARKGLPAGSDRLKVEIEEVLARQIGDGRRGRPRKGL